MKTKESEKSPISSCSLSTLKQRAAQGLPLFPDSDMEIENTDEATFTQGRETEPGKPQQQDTLPKPRLKAHHNQRQGSPQKLSPKEERRRQELTQELIARGVITADKSHS